MLTVKSFSPDVFGRVFGGPFTQALSEACHTLPFEEAWRKAIVTCEGDDDVTVPSSFDEVGTYHSRSGKVYYFSRLEGGEYLIDFAPDTCLCVEALQRQEVELGHYPAELEAE